MREMRETPQTDSEPALAAAAVAGEALAIERLLMGSHRRLAARVAHRLPEDLRRVVSVDDVLQETYVDAFRYIGKFKPDGPDGFFHWLASIAEHRMIDAIRAHRAAKRGGGAFPQDTPADAWAGSLINLLREAGHDANTPSRSAARREAVAAVALALPGLKKPYRDVIRMRYIEGVPAETVAERMNRTPSAVAMTSRRALEALRRALGRSSRYLSR